MMNPKNDMTKIPQHQERWNERSSGLFIGGAAILLLLGLVFGLAGFSSRYWVEGSVDINGVTTMVNHGLWHECEKVGTAAKKCESTMGTTEATWFRVVQGMTILALAGSLLSFCLFIYWSCSFSRYFFHKILLMCSVGLVGILQLASIITFGVEYKGHFTDTSLKWSFFLYMVSGVLTILSIPCIAFVSSFELQPLSQWERFSASRGAPRGGGPIAAMRPSYNYAGPGLPALRAPIAPLSIPRVLPSNNIPRSYHPPVTTLQQNGGYNWRENSRI